MFAGLKRSFYPSVLTVQASVAVTSPTGTITHTWTNVTDMVALPCRVAPAGGGEARTQEQVLSQLTQTCVIPLDLRNITVLMRAQVDGEIFNVVSVDYDGQNLLGGSRQSTRLTLEVVS